jgi:RNA polymerase sigma factor (sigma-70 family)
MTENQTLLRQYTTQGSREALDGLIRRHMDLVYSSALRQVRDPHLAEDVTQAVFLILVQKAGTIRDGVAVGGWLLAVTRRAAVHAMNKRNLDRRHDEAIAKPELAEAQAAAWEQVAPVLDGAMAALPQRDRDAVVLRVLENRSFAQVGAELGVSEDAATKRVGWALARLRQLLGRRGVKTGAAALSATLAAHGVQVAPAHLLAATLSATATGTASACVAAIAKGTLSAMAWASVQITAAVTLGLLLLGIAGFGLAMGREPAAPAAVVTNPLAMDPAAGLPEPQAMDLTAALPGPQPNDVFRMDDLFPGFRTTSAPAATPVATQPTAAFEWRVILPKATYPTAIATDGAGNIYAVGQTLDDAGQTHGIVREKRNGQTEWTTVFDSPRLLTTVTVSAAGNVYVSEIRGNVFLRPAGQSDFLTTPIDRGTRSVMDMATDAAGNLYAVGDQNEHWIVRKQALGAGPFTTVDDFVADASVPRWNSNKDMDYPNSAKGITVVPDHLPSAGIYVVGHASEFAGNDANGKPVYKCHWITRKSSDGGRTWSTVDDFVKSNSLLRESNYPRRVRADLLGNVYVVGYAMEQTLLPPGTTVAQDAPSPFYTQSSHWIVRKSATGNRNSWFTDDDFVLSAKNPHAKAQAAAADPKGNIYVVGCASDDFSNPDNGGGIIRTNAGGIWHIVDQYQPISSDANLYAVTVDARGRVYVGGWSQAVEKMPVWFVRSYMPGEGLAAIPASVPNTLPRP